jgi:mono/diheme cytochrome c family protein
LNVTARVDNGTIDIWSGNQSPGTDSLIAIILSGSRLPSTAPAPSALAMPPFGWRYNDTEIAELATFVRTSWGNGGSAVMAAEVAAMRKSLSLEDAQR